MKLIRIALLRSGLTRTFRSAFRRGFFPSVVRSTMSTRVRERGESGILVGSPLVGARTLNVLASAV